MILYIITVCMVLLRLVPRVRPLVEFYLPLRIQWLPSAIMGAVAFLAQNLNTGAPLLDNIEILLSVFVALILAAQKGIDGNGR